MHEVLRYQSLVSPDVLCTASETSAAPIRLLDNFSDHPTLSSLRLDRSD